MGNVTQFPRFTIRSSAATPIQGVDTVRAVRESSKADLDENIQIVNRDLLHAIKRANVVAEAQDALPWLARLLQTALDDVKASIEASKP